MYPYPVSSSEHVLIFLVHHHPPISINSLTLTPWLNWLSLRKMVNNILDTDKINDINILNRLIYLGNVTEYTHGLYTQYSIQG